MISDAIISLVIASGTGLLALLIKVVHNSKCVNVKCCGNQCIRDTTHETNINIDNNTTPNRI